MKKILAIVCVMLVGTMAAHAQFDKGRFAVGASVLYGSEIESAGINARAQYSILNNARVELSGDYFFKHNETTMYDLNLNVHCPVNLSQQRLFIYPIIGLAFTHADYPTPAEDLNKVGINLGSGIEYNLNNRISIELEYRHSIMKSIDQGVIGLGVNYKL